MIYFNRNQVNGAEPFTIYSWNILNVFFCDKKKKKKIKCFIHWSQCNCSSEFRIILYTLVWTKPFWKFTKIDRTKEKRNIYQKNGKQVMAIHKQNITKNNYFMWHFFLIFVDKNFNKSLSIHYIFMINDIHNTHYRQTFNRDSI